MKKKLLRIVALLFFSLEAVHFTFSAFMMGNKELLLPLKISPQSPTEHHIPATKNKYSPHELRRIYLFEHIHKSVERAKKGTIS